jgi:WD40 repeat protein
MAQVGLAAALSPDGSKVAIPVQYCGKVHCYFGFEVLPTSGKGTAKMWSTQNGLADNLSWSSDGKQILFATAASDTTNQYRVLNATGPGGNMISESRPVMIAQYDQLMLLTPDGRALVGSTVANGPGRHTLTGKFIEVSRSTGHVLRVLHVVTGHYTGSTPWPTDTNCNLLALGPQGVQPLVECFQRFGRMDGGKFTALRGGPSPTLHQVPPRKPGTRRSWETDWGAAW